MKKITIFLLLFSMIGLLSGCNSNEFLFKSIDNVDDIKCLVSITSPYENEGDEGAYEGIDDGAGNSTTIIEDPSIKDAYNSLCQNSVAISEFNIENEDELIYLTFYSGDESSAKTGNDGITHYGTFVITKAGRFIARNTPDDDKSYYYQGEENIYNRIMDIIGGCKF